MASALAGTATVVQVEHLIIGGGVVGLAIAARLSANKYVSNSGAGRPAVSTLLVEQHPYLANEASSRNSEVIHAGLYYPTDSLKTRYCVLGRRMLYALCQQHSINHRKTGKWLVSTSPTEHRQLEAIFNRITGHPELRAQIPLHWVPRQEWQRQEPMLLSADGNVHSVLCSPESGIVDSHGLISLLEAQILDNPRSLISLGTRIPLQPCTTTTTTTASTTTNDPYSRIWFDPDAKQFPFRTPVTITVAPATPRRPEPLTKQLIIESRTVINSAGLWSDQIAAALHSQRTKRQILPRHELDALQIYPCKGHYYSFSIQNTAPVSRLIYPVPDPGLKGLGVHCTPDLSGTRIRLGPDAEYIVPVPPPHKRNDYSIDDTGTEAELARRRRFFDSVGRYLRLDPKRDWEKFRVDYSSVRCKLSPPDSGGVFRDFVVRDEAAFGAPGFMNLVGIESPGLTASLAIAQDVVDRLIQPYI